MNDSSELLVGDIVFGEGFEGITNLELCPDGNL